MSTSATDRSPVRTLFVSLCLSILCAVFGGVYEIFSHGVWSGFMVYAFLFPLLLETLPCAVLTLLQRPLPRPWPVLLHHAGVAALTVGNIMEGVLAIYGTTNRLTIVYWVAGGLLLMSGIILGLFQHE